MNLSSGGPTTCTHDLLEGISAINDGVKLLTFNDSSNIAGSGKPWLKLVDPDGITPLMISRNFKQALCSEEYDIYHCNALWLYSNHITCKIARDKHKPYIISTHGMLYPTALKIKPWKKWPMMKLWFHNDIMKATCIHATCEEERDYVRKFGYKGPIAVIPNPVVVPPNILCKQNISERKSIGFLGRLHPIKKVENLIYAMDLVRKKHSIDFTLEIIGKGSVEYERYLRSIVEKLGLNENVNFVGFLTGDIKYHKLSEMWALFVPSEQENFGMIVPEALVCGTPVYASLGTPWRELRTHNCGWWEDNSPSTIASIIEALFSKTKAELLTMGKSGRNLVLGKYEQHIVAKMMVDLYSWILNKKAKPEFVYE